MSHPARMRTTDMGANAKLSGPNGPQEKKR